ncbi:hypothetical protein PI124_g10419 [Phytophthora idaei]|nr:hypothetical protein PI125_g6349 [Phytophthora idaei]KAG3162354.1 hypothetical protein PI126_g6019 [Phytophthora idaei]KAG3244837.1 hypothetical protein PI124_g10419 [Phytophthora idaei]
MGRDETVKFHRTLASHPARAPIIPINSVPKIALKTVLEGNAEQVDVVAGEIVKSKKRFRDVEELTDFIRNIKRVKVTVDADLRDFCPKSRQCRAT